MKATLQSTPSFKYFVFRKYGVIIWFAVICSTLQFVLFKSLFPFANFIPDSYGYLDAALNNSDIHIWPIGYAKFLRLFRGITTSDTALVLTQYLFLQLTTVYFIFTLLYLLKPGKILSYILLIFFIINPLALSISNYISSDALFTSLSLLWTACLLWIVYLPKPFHVWLQSLVLFLAFTVRYNALYYPLVATIILLISRTPWRAKVTCIGLSILLIGTFIWHSGNEYKKLIGTTQFSAFSGWQIASNALFMYSRLRNNDNIPPKQFTSLHRTTLKHIDSLKHLSIRPDSILGVYYLWNEKAPLQRHMEDIWGPGINSAVHFKEWASLSQLYASYGTYLIRHHPISYIKYYIYPNTVNYFIPPSEIFDYYNVEGNNVRPLAQFWFNYKSTSINGLSKETKILRCFSILCTLVNCLFAYSVIMFILLKRFRKSNHLFRSIFYLAIILWLTNMIFSILASPIVLRYQIFPMTIFLPYGAILFDYILNTDA